MKNLLLITVVLALLCIGGFAQALPAVEVSQSVSGSAGNWVYDFTVTNNMLPEEPKVYQFGVLFGTRDIVGSPTDWNPDIWTSWKNSRFGGSSIVYNNVWNYGGGILGGSQLSGFKVHSTSLQVNTNWFVLAYGGVPYSGTGYFNEASEPGFEGVTVQAVPEPSSMIVLGSGVVGLLGFLRRRRS